MINFVLPASQKLDIFDLVITSLFDNTNGISFKQLHEVVNGQTEIAESELLPILGELVAYQYVYTICSGNYAHYYWDSKDNSVSHVETKYHITDMVSDYAKLHLYSI